MNIIVLGAGSAGLMSAILIKRFYKNSPFDVKIIQSGKAPILGVGEGTTEHVQHFIQHARIDEAEFIRESKATLKAGVQFDDWLYPGHRYIHSLDSYHVEVTHDDDNLYTSGRPIHNQGYNLGMYASIISEGIDTYKNQSQSEGYTVGYPSQFHFNNFALNDYLKRKCAEFDIEIIDDYINDFKYDEQGYMRCLIGSKEYHADFFFDCSGFKGLLINQFKPNFIDYSDQLIVDRALFFPYKTLDNPRMFTLSKAMQSGWFWQAPTQDRTGNGYVYSSQYCTPEKALDEVRGLGFDLKDDVVNNIKEFRSGHLEKSWIKNVVAIGIASSFFEPMEAAALSTGILQTINVLEYLHAFDKNDELIADLYNDRMKDFYYNAFEFIRLHYVTGREDTPFWQEYKYKPLPKSLKQKLKIWGRKPPVPEEFNIQQPQALYGNLNFMQVMNGLNLIDKQAYKNYISKWGLDNRLMSKLIELDILVNKNLKQNTHNDVLSEINK